MSTIQKPRQRQLSAIDFYSGVRFDKGYIEPLRDDVMLQQEIQGKEIYGSSAHYLRVAQPNNLDGFRDLTPGQKIVFPPIEK